MAKLVKSLPELQIPAILTLEGYYCSTHHREEKIQTETHIQGPLI